MEPQCQYLEVFPLDMAGFAEKTCLKSTQSLKTWLSVFWQVTISEILYVEKFCILYIEIQASSSLSHRPWDSVFSGLLLCFKQVAVIVCLFFFLPFFPSLLVYAFLKNSRFGEGVKIDVCVQPTILTRIHCFIVFSISFWLHTQSLDLYKLCAHMLCLPRYYNNIWWVSYYLQLFSHSWSHLFFTMS